MIGKTAGGSKSESASGSQVSEGVGVGTWKQSRSKPLQLGFLPGTLHSALHAPRLRKADADLLGQGHVPHSANTLVQGVWSHGPFPSQQPGGSSQNHQCVPCGACF